ncbi:hypothetical protein O6H91_16G013000 [Diphasiastrum complanatum]|nr:hypothetical protein O6H91_16G013000 [Diphasiastrum complanatum]
MHDPNQPSAVVIRGLPIDDNLPPSTPEGHRHKNSSQQFMSETWLVGIARIVGQPFNYEFLAKAAGVAAEGMGLLIRQLYPMPEQEKLVSALGSREFLDFHMDGFQVLPQCYPNCLVFIGLRGDPSKVAKTLLCDFRELYSELNPDAIDILLREKITWKAPSLPGAAGFCKHILEGTEANPVINIYDENIGVSTTFDEVVGGSAAAVAAYRHAKEVARKVGVRREGVWLDAGDVLLVNQRRCAHGRRAFAAAYDGKDRWMQRVYVNEGAIWEPTGLVPWPIRALPFEFAHKVEA